MQGKLTRWNDERGFGFIQAVGEGPEVFIHISVLKKAGRRPVVGDTISFEMHTDNDGRNRAVNAVIHGVAPARVSGPQRTIKRNRATSGGLIATMLSVAVLIGAGLFAYDKVIRGGSPAPNRAPPAAAVHSPAYRVSSDFSCQGKVYCSQMTSCAEATFYLRNCPGTKMDGDSDGIPCEGQWCGR